VRRWLRRAWTDYVEFVDVADMNAITKPGLLVTVLVFGAAPGLAMAYVPVVQRMTGFRAPFLYLGLLATGLCFSYLLYRATLEPVPARGRLALLNLLDTGFLAAALVALSGCAEHPADCLLALLPVIVAVIWGMGQPFSWPMLVPAALLPTGLMAAISGGHLLRPTIVALGVPFYSIVGLTVLRRARGKREAADAARAKLGETARLATLGTVGASLAHEMNQPLGTIRSLAEQLRRNGAAGTPAELESLALASSRLSRLVDQIGLLAAPQPGTMEPLDPVTPVEDALLLLRSQLEHRAIELLWTAPERPLPRVMADRQRIGQVVVNLLVNARDALEGMPAARSIRIELAAADGRVTLAVTDSGPGVPAETEPHLFDPFFTTKERGRGGGLGLSISREIAEQHGGTLTFERPAEGGARFRLTLPAAS
jgi:signal transduction histidine kinase